jgi:hypothetical protein
LQLYCETERVLTCLGESRGPVSFGFGYLRALAYQLRKWLAANLV